MKTKYVRMHLRGSKVLVDDTFAQANIAVPIDADRNVGIVIREVNCEFLPDAALATALDKREIQLTTKTQSAIVGIDDPCVIVKLGEVFNGAAGLGALPIVVSKELKPPAPVFNQEIYIGAECDSAGTLKWDIVYDVATFDEGEMMSLMKQHLL